jgi:hypothetical protein
MIAAKVDCTDVNDSFSSSNSEDFSFILKSVQFGLLVNCWGYGCSFLCIWGILME